VTTLIDVRRGLYLDSVALMQISQVVARSPGVSAALVAMATELNLDLLAGLDFAVPEQVGPADLLVAIRAADDAALQQALSTLESELSGSTGPRGAGEGPAAVPPHTTGSAAERSASTLALVSVPGQHAFTEAMDALDSGLSVLLFSDNVTVEQEIRLKDEAQRRGLLVMGPDCGTAVVSGVGLGFATDVQPGPVGIVAASGTGAQQLLALLDLAGVGVSHCLGVGGRDLSAAVGGRSTRQALAALLADASTEVVVVVSKPPSDEVAAQVRELAAGGGKPVVLALLGPGRPDLTAAAEEVVAATGAPVPAWPTWGDRSAAVPRPGLLRGLYSGGTLCDEAMGIAAATLGPVHSNIPLDPTWALGPGHRSDTHLMIDFGDDELTRGRPHPMIDNTLRLARLAEEAADPRTAVILLDVVLGHGAHPDPAADLAPAIEDARAGAAAAGRGLAVVVALVGSTGDPQGLPRQATALAGAGALVFASNAQAARQAVSLVQEGRA
jgi:FdrA protein